MAIIKRLTLLSLLTVLIQVCAGQAAIKNTGSLCPKPGKTFPVIPELTRDSYISLAKTLMTTYGPKTGAVLTEIQGLLEKTTRPSEAADIGALFLIAGSGSATVYCTSWSVIRQPDDVLTANTLGVALKDLGEHIKSLQVLNYADKIRPGVPLVMTNIGWVYYEMGNQAMAKKMFEKALAAEPEFTSPHLGLGLLAECAGDHFTAEKHLKIALADSYSATGLAGYRQAKSAQTGSSGNSAQSSSQDQSLQNEKGSAEGFDIPDLPVYEEPKRMIQQEIPLASYIDRLDRRIAALTNYYMSVASTVRAQNIRANQNPDGAIVYRRDFANELMMFQDAAELLFGPNSNFGMALSEGAGNCEKKTDIALKDIEAVIQDMDHFNRLSSEINECTMQWVADMEACGNDDVCQSKVKAKYEACSGPRMKEREDVAFRICKRTKNELDLLWSCNLSMYTKASRAFRSAASDFYAFTDPVLERIYAPSYNELLNINRELVVLTFQKSLAGMASALPGIAEGYNSLQCIEPENPGPPEEAEDPKLPEKKNDDCPLGDGIKGGWGPISAELTCDHVTVSGGEGILGKITRDFKKHETTIWVGAGAKVEYGNGNLSGEATVGVEVVIGSNNTVEDVGLTSSVKTGLGGLMEAEVSGRISVRGGPEITTSVEATPPGITDILPDPQR